MRSFAALALSLVVAACGAQSATDAGAPAAGGSAVPTEAGGVDVVEVAGGLDHPWGMTFLPDGRMLVTERPGRLRIVSLDGTVSPPVEGTPAVYAEGQGGLLDVALDPDFEETGYVYLTYARPGPDGGAATAIGRGRLVGDRIEGFEPLFTQEPYYDGGNHFGGRIAFSPDGYLFVSTGERFQFDPAQDLSNHLGVVVRIERDGSVPDDNPFVGQEGARPEIWSYGHRNVQSLAFDPATGTLWEAEFGPRGGDELNRIEAGANYGWPVVSWGTNYDGSPIPDPPTRPEFTDAVVQWTPVISPSGMAFYAGDVFPGWTGDLLISNLSGQGVTRVEIDGDEVTGQETISLGTRIRDLEVGPDGNVYLLTDRSDGAVWRMDPAQLAE